MPRLNATAVYLASVELGTSSLVARAMVEIAQIGIRSQAAHHMQILLPHGVHKLLFGKVSVHH
jgi:hypothetical protein